MPPRSPRPAPPGPAAAAAIEEYLAGLEPGQRAALEHLRAVVMGAAPGGEAMISYAMPAVRFRGRPLVAYAAARHHLALYPMSGELVERHASELAGFSTAKGTIRFTPDRPLPDGLLETIVRERVAQIEARVRRPAG